MELGFHFNESQSLHIYKIISINKHGTYRQVWRKDQRHFIREGLVLCQNPTFNSDSRELVDESVACRKKRALTDKTAFCRSPVVYMTYCELELPLYGWKIFSSGKKSTKPLYFEMFLRWPESMVLKVLLKFGMWSLIYILSIQDMYFYVYIIVDVCCILNGQQKSKIQDNEIIHTYIQYITSVNSDSGHGI